MALTVAVFLTTAGTASAATFTVSNDASSGGGSLAGALTVAEANNNAPTVDRIVFDLPLSADNTIDETASSQLPTITEPVEIAGCSETPASTVPCVGIRGAAAAAGEANDVLTLLPAGGAAADGSAITGVAISRGNGGVSVFSGEDVVIRNSWFGLGLNGSPTGQSLSVGVFLGSGADGGVLGGSDPGDRNVISNSRDVGVLLNDPDGTVLEANLIGTDPTGTEAIPNRLNVRAGENFLPSNPDDRFEGLRIGGSLPAPGVCSGPCNLISAATDTAGFGQGIALGRGFENGPVDAVVSGNFIGVNLAGTASLQNDEAIELIDTDGATIGGPTAADGNVIAGGEEFVIDALTGFGEEPIENLVIENNLVGTNAAGTAHLGGESPGGVSVSVGSPSNPPVLRDNLISSIAFAAVGVGGDGAVIVGNRIGSGSDGAVLPAGQGAVHTGGATDTTVRANSLANSSVAGLRIERTSGTRATGNLIRANGAAGVQIVSGPAGDSSGNVIGGDSVADQNTISDNGGAAIAVIGSASTANSILGNRGSGNEGPFIDLGGDGLGNAVSGPHGGVQAPVISGGDAVGATGTAAPGSVIRLFAKAGTAPGELDRLVGIGTAGPSGAWSVPYLSPQSGLLTLAATATTASGTSELSGPLTVDATPRSAAAPDPRCKQLRKKLKKAKSKKRKRKLRRKLRRLGC